MIIMKKIGIIFLSVTMVFLLAACNSNKGKTDNQTEKQTDSVKRIEEEKTTEKVTEAMTEETTEAETEMTTEETTEVQVSEEKADKADNQSADTNVNSSKEKQLEQNDVSEQKASVNSNQQADVNQNDTGNSGQNTANFQETENTIQPTFAAYSPQNVVSLATAKCQAGGMITTQQNLQNHLYDGSITQEEYNEYYPYDGMEGSYYSVFVETDLNKASAIDGQRLPSEDAIAGYIAGMLLLETDPVFYISYDGVYTTGGTDYYEFRCHR